jgi:uncharacterized membrane protein
VRWSPPADGGRAALACSLALTAFLLAWAALHADWWQEVELVDTPTYEAYGDAIARGDVPYRDFVPEYPPLALPVFVVPSLVVGADASQERYARAFDVEMLVCGAALVVLVWWTLVALGASGAALVLPLAFVAVAPLLLGSLVLTRFDLWPVLLTSAALAALVSGRDRLGAGLLGAAVAAKLYPAVLVPLVAVWIWRRRGRRELLVAAGVFGAVLALCVVPFLLVAPDGVASSLWRQLDRPLQLESLPAALLVLAGAADVETSHGSQNLAGNAGVALGIVMSVAAAAVLVWLWLRFPRGPMEPARLVCDTAACVVAFVALGKVLSPQFLLWLVPLVPLVRGRRGLAASALLAVALVLTQSWFPRQYWDYATGLERGVAALVVARDLVLLALLAVLVSRPRARA